MRCSSLLLSGSLLAVAAQLVGAAGLLKPRRTSSLLINPDAQPDLPSASSAKAAAAAASLDLNNIQGDILVGMKKNKELFFFFAINGAAAFKAKLKTDIHDLITTTTQLLSVSTQPLTAVNLAFSQVGITTLGITDNLGDSLFAAGQETDASALGDPGTTNWVPQFVGKGIHGVFLLASDTVDNVNSELDNIKTILGNSITEVYSLQGAARPGNEAGHEHFGFMDGISQPAVDGFSTPLPGQAVVPAGIILVGEANDPSLSSRPAWAKDGSFLAFRQLEQKVPEFNKFLEDNPIPIAGFTPEQGSELLGARMVGRWKSGAPIDLTPLADDPVLAADPQRNNNFNFSHPGEDITSNQTRCPFSAHIRKTAPRADFNPVNIANHIVRAGIPYGPEVSSTEASSNTSSTERGLAFVSYQSAIGNGFHFLQQVWANNQGFIFGKSDPTPGFDPIIGVATNGQTRFTSGLDTTDPNHDYTIPDFIVSHGGEYFFSPSLSAIAGTLSN